MALRHLLGLDGGSTADAGHAAGHATEQGDEKECNFADLMLGNQVGKWQPERAEIKWNYDHQLKGEELSVWWPGRTERGECGNVADKSRGCWYRARLVGDPGCLPEGRCLHAAYHDGEPTNTFTCPTWVKDADGNSCKLPQNWQACPTKFHLARVDTGIPQQFKQAVLQTCGLTGEEKALLGPWRERSGSVTYEVTKTDLAQLKFVVEAQKKPPPPQGGLQATLGNALGQVMGQVASGPAQLASPGPGQAPGQQQLQVPGGQLAQGGPALGADQNPSADQNPLAVLGLGKGRGRTGSKRSGILMKQGEWYGAKLLDEQEIPTGEEVRVQLDNKGVLRASFRPETGTWGPALDAIKDVKTVGGTANGASCMFPFDYDGISFNECTPVDRGRPWCMTDASGNWGFCKDQVPHKPSAKVGTHGGSFQGAGPLCVFPFTHNSVVHNSCQVISDLAADSPTCMTDAEGSWGYCNCKIADGANGAKVQTHGGTAEGASCMFPFEYNGKKHHSCADLGDGAPACFTDDSGNWGYCNCKQPPTFMAPGNHGEEDQVSEKTGTEAAVKERADHCTGGTQGLGEVNLIFDVHHNSWHRCTQKFRCEPWDIRAIHEGNCGEGLRCKEGDFCFVHRVTSKRSTHECVPGAHVFVLSDGDDVAKFSVPSALVTWAAPLRAQRRLRRRGTGSCWRRFL